jgi:hypothetical protein
VATGLDVPSAPMSFDEPDPEVVPADPAPGDDAFDAAQGAVLSSFAADRVSAAVAPEPAPGVALTARGDDPGVAFALALNREAEGLDLAPVGDESEAGIAFALALNRESEGLDPLPAVESVRAVSPMSEAVGPAGPASRLAQAVRLTREAVAAWASLLHGPAVVTIGH